MSETLDNLHKILDTTLESFLDLVQCDAGSVYTVRKDKDGQQILTFEAMITRSINLRVPSESLPVPQRSDANSSSLYKDAGATTQSRICCCMLASGS